MGIFDVIGMTVKELVVVIKIFIFVYSDAEASLYEFLLIVHF